MYLFLLMRHFIVRKEKTKNISDSLLKANQQSNIITCNVEIL